MRESQGVYEIGESEVFHCNQNGAFGKGILLGEKCFRVLSGSVGRTEAADSCPPQVKILREKLVKSGDVKVQGGIFTLQADRDFSSSSTAAAFLTGYSRNGLAVWKNSRGKSLKEVLEERRAELTDGKCLRTVVSDLLFCNQNDARGTGVLLADNGFRVYRLSVGRKEMAESCPKLVAVLREQLIMSGQISVEGGHFVMQSDYDFDSPSTAAQFLTGYSRNGLDVWKSREGKTLKQLKDAATLP